MILILISKEDFVSCINEIKAAIDYQNDLNKLFSKHNVDGYLFQPDCTDTTVKLLELIMEDTDGWISYFCWDLDFGRCYEDGMILDECGSNIKLSTVDDLYKILMRDAK